MVKKVITESMYKDITWKLHGYEQKKLWIKIRRYELMYHQINHIIPIQLIKKGILPFKDQIRRPARHTYDGQGIYIVEPGAL